MMWYRRNSDSRYQQAKRRWLATGDYEALEAYRAEARRAEICLHENQSCFYQQNLPRMGFVTFWLRCTDCGENFRSEVVQQTYPSKNWGANNMPSWCRRKQAVISRPCCGFIGEPSLIRCMACLEPICDECLERCPEIAQPYVERVCGSRFCQECGIESCDNMHASDWKCRRCDNSIWDSKMGLLISPETGNCFHCGGDPYTGQYEG